MTLPVLPGETAIGVGCFGPGDPGTVLGLAASCIRLVICLLPTAKGETSPYHKQSL